MGNCGNCSGSCEKCSTCGGCGQGLELTMEEILFLQELGQYSFLPVARKMSDMIPVYLENGEENKELISIVVPVYNEGAHIRKSMACVEEICDNAGILYELVLIDDGSKDNSWEVLASMAKENPRVTALRLSRNFGKEPALCAGLDAASGDAVIVMDADLQDPPSLLPEMLYYLEEEGYDSVATRRVTRKGEPLIRSFFARRFYALMKRISKTEIVDGARDYRLMRRSVVDAILSMTEYNRFTKGIFGWVGFETKWLEFENIERTKGETKWNFWKLFAYSLDGILAFSTMPLAFVSIIGYNISS